ncbi:hypothetical protein BP00DRAFT_338038 [Aspergillus indologenus CBS 114.80]|uniref:Tat pathway signal sequence n=1 Tax=Aspergillus indologenus CBS 114.80 TaxID=1450541 RepID=A0A2V5IF58_9EURO|nr:hypothetical protein BP00DRAFT_338038 [Aspergillus indologenus CBS 114.80]
MSIAAWVAHRPSPACASIRGQGKPNIPRPRILPVRESDCLVAELRGLDLRYVSTKFSDYTKTPFFQDPGPATDEAWEALMAGMLIRVTAEELSPANQSSILLPQDSNQLAWLGVYHDLHCINTLRRWIHRDYYHPNLTGAEFNKFQAHTSHCLDMLRQTVQCHADAYLMTFRWTDSEPKPAFNPAMPRRTCVDFDLMRQSLKPRFVGLEEIQGLKNPLMNQGM